MATITAGWLAKFETSPAKLGCRSRGASCSGSPRITAAEAISWTGEAVRRWVNLSPSLFEVRYGPNRAASNSLKLVPPHLRAAHLKPEPELPRHL
jgi:hypothetical protein